MKRLVRSTLLASLLATACPAAPPTAEAPPAKVAVTSTVTGSFKPTATSTVKLTHAAAFVDTEDARKPLVIVLSDAKLPTAGWKSSLDLAMAAHGKFPFSGVVFFLDAEGTAFRTDTYEKGEQASVSGYFDLKVEDLKAATLTGTVTTRRGTKGPAADAVFKIVR